MTDFFMRVDRPENRHVWRFLTSDADAAETEGTVSIPRRDWIPTSTFDKADAFAKKKPTALPGELIMVIIEAEDPDGHKWLKANSKNIPMTALKRMWEEFNSEDGMSEGESGASSDS